MGYGLVPPGRTEACLSCRTGDQKYSVIGQKRDSKTNICLNVAGVLKHQVLCGCHEDEAVVAPGGRAYTYGSAVLCRLFDVQGGSEGLSVAATNTISISAKQHQKNSLTLGHV